MYVSLLVIASTTPFLCAVLYIIYNMIWENARADTEDVEIGTSLEPLLKRYNK